MKINGKIIIIVSAISTILLLIALVFAIISFKRSNNYYLESNGKIVYCNSKIWMRLQNKEIDNIFCSYNKENDDNVNGIVYQEWNGKYPLGYFEYEKGTN